MSWTRLLSELRLARQQSSPTTAKTPAPTARIGPLTDQNVCETPEEEEEEEEDEEEATQAADAATATAAAPDVCFKNWISLPRIL